jgi:hypothetical protein
MRDILLQVRPAAPGWLLECAGAMEPLMFLSGAKAEAQAHTLAKSLAGAGNDTRVLVHDATHHLVGSTRYFARSQARA